MSLIASIGTTRLRLGATAGAQNRMKVAVLAGPFIIAWAGWAFAVHADGGAAWQGDHALLVLLRFMAVLKAGAFAGAAALVLWRLSAPLRIVPAIGYAVALSFMAAAPGLIWSLEHVASGAVLFHAGLVTAAIVALRDYGIAVRRAS